MKNYPKNVIRADILKVLAVATVWIFAVLFLRLFAASKIHQIANHQFNPPVNTTFFIQPGIKWDSFHYLSIAEKGYGVEKNALPAFYPLFPALVRAGAEVTGLSNPAVGLLLNIICVIVASIFLYLLAKDFFEDDNQAMRVLLLFLLFPFSYFLLAFYTEALFCALSFGAFYFARKRKWLLACSLLGLVSAVRVTGLLVILAVFVEYLDSINWSWKKLNSKILLFALAPLGFIAYVVYLWNHFGDPLMFKNAYKYGWSYQVFDLNIIKTVYKTGLGFIMQLLKPPSGWKDDWLQQLYTTFYEMGSWLLGLWVFVMSILKKFPVSYIFYVGITLVLTSLNSNFVSANRYLLPLFPLYLLIVKLLSKRSEVWYGLVLGVSAATMGIMLTLFSNGYWTG